MKRYTHFEEIDKDLKFLRLKSRIDKEQIKISFRESKEIVHETFSPLNLIADFAGSMIKKAFLLRVVDKIIGIGTGRRK